ncbi:nicotinate-nucleotide adenylyltransferase [Polaribacter sp. SA4-12]|uniref:nicotinate-nucleotide adenylyltransferase n=1 Tax=Polaribacter sp. SA4-12 TaxID=1312072 RepID=UPI000B3C179B|nr:nicotinate-nucleotide adenylyltransferase [Polaribacter sp. SA4-12]ARV15960.1 nicotinate-nucleotide adenylyltransferase [Polaribacter sp. SA4-12]
MKKLIILLFVVGISLPAFAQDPIELSEITILSRNYRYLDKINSEKVAVPVKLLQRKAAAYDVTKSDFYDDDYDYYTVSFFIPKGKIVAVYDKVGNITRTIEKYKNIAIPKKVATAVVERFPKWVISKDVYLVSYSDDKKKAKKVYKLTLENGNKRLKVKTDANGKFL